MTVGLALVTQSTAMEVALEQAQRDLVAAFVLDLPSADAATAA